jgi:hypothetical protein
MANKKFTARLRDALGEIASDASMKCLPLKSGRLYSPVFRGGKYEWVIVMDSDGLLVSARKVNPGEGVTPADIVELKVGVILQSEEATAQTKPNPIGKASLAHLPSGVWVDQIDGTRIRLDHVLVLFVIPKGAAAKKLAKFATAKQNVMNAADLMPDAVYLEIPSGASGEAVYTVLKKAVRPFLVGRGRPRHSA